MANFSQLLAINDPQALGEEYSRKAIEDAKIQAQTQVNKESKAFNIANAIVGGVTAYMTGGGSLLAAGAGALGAPRGGLKPISSLTGGAIAGTGLKSITGGATGIENELSALSTTKNFGKTAELLGGITGDQTMLEAGRNIGKLQAVELKAQDEAKKLLDKKAEELAEKAKTKIDEQAQANQANMYNALSSGISSGKLSLEDCKNQLTKNNQEIADSRYNDETKKYLLDNNKGMMDKLTGYAQKYKDQVLKAQEESNKKSEEKEKPNADAYIVTEQGISGKTNTLTTDLDALVLSTNIAPKNKEAQINKRTRDTIMYYDQKLNVLKSDDSLSDKDKIALSKKLTDAKKVAQTLAANKIKQLSVERKQAGN